VTKHWAQKRFADCTPLEKMKLGSLWAACLLGIASILVVLFFLDRFRWGYCP